MQFAADIPTALKHRSAPQAVLAVTAAALVTLVLAVGANARPSSEAIRLRNALLVASTPIAQFDWHPDRAPAAFLQETAAAPPLVGATAARLASGTQADAAVAIALASFLAEHAGDGGPVQSLDAERTLRAIIDEGKGYCADFVDAFTALALAAGLQPRAWAFSFDGFGGRGHMVAEIFDRQRQAWIVLDVFNNVYPQDRDSGEWLSARALRALLLADSARVHFQRLGPGRLGYPVEAKLLEYYRRGAPQWYLWMGNNVFSRAEHSVVRLAATGSVAAAELAAVALDTYPSIAIPVDAYNRVAVERLYALKQRLVAALLVAAALALVLLVVPLALLWRAHRRSRPGSTVASRP